MAISDTAAPPAGAPRFDLRRLLRRHPRPEAGPVVLGRRRIYILPTRAGLLFALVMLALLIGATNYGNNLVYALTFVLSASGFLSMLHAWRNLAGLSLAAGPAEPVFAGAAAHFPLALDGHGRPRYGLALQQGDHAPLVVDLPAVGSVWHTLSLPAPRRGRLPLGRFTIHTHYPLGLFRAWSRIELISDCLVYPAPAEQSTLPPLSGDGAPLPGQNGRGGDDFVALRPYQPGDPLSQIHWKSFARGEQVLVKQFGGEAGRELWLELGTTPGADLEERLSHLCRQLLDAEAAGARYGLKLGTRELPLGSGAAHRERCLEALALFGEAP